jgi:hypothetical protein
MIPSSHITKLLASEHVDDLRRAADRRPRQRRVRPEWIGWVDRAQNRLRSRVQRRRGGLAKWEGQ